jgi:hypothetical protein
VNETTLEPNPLSQFVYVELINKMDSVLYRVKIKKDSLGFAGHIKLKPEIPPEPIPCGLILIGCRMLEMIFSSLKIFNRE